MAWVLTGSVKAFRDEIDEVFPGRDKASDGTIGDQAHATGVSGHNPDRTGNAEFKDGDSKDEVRATDIDRDLVPGSAIDYAERVVQHIVQLARSGAYVPFRYVIYKRRIWSRSTGWATRQYTGANAHDKHFHLSGDYSERADNWGDRLGLAAVREDDVALSAAEIEQVATAVVAKLLGTKVKDGGLNDGTEYTIKSLLEYEDERHRRVLAGVVTDNDVTQAGVEAVGSLVKAAGDTTHSSLVAVGEALAAIQAGMQVPVTIDYPALAKAMFDEMERRATGGEEGN